MVEEREVRVKYVEHGGSGKSVRCLRGRESRAGANVGPTVRARMLGERLRQQAPGADAGAEATPPMPRAASPE